MWSFPGMETDELDISFGGISVIMSGMCGHADMDTGELDSESDDELSNDTNADSMHFDFTYRKQSSNGLPFTVHDIGMGKNQANKVC